MRFFTFFRDHFLIPLLIFISAVLIVFPVFQLLVQPEKNVTPMLAEFNKADVFNSRLNHFESILLPISKLLDKNVSLKYVGNEDYFVYFQAALAPRRISPDLDSDYLLILAAQGVSLRQVADDHNARLLALLATDLGLFQSVGQK